MICKLTSEDLLSDIFKFNAMVCFLTTKFTLTLHHLAFWHVLYPYANFVVLVAMEHSKYVMSILSSAKQILVPLSS